MTVRYTAVSARTVHTTPTVGAASASTRTAKARRSWSAMYGVPSTSRRTGISWRRSTSITTVRPHAMRAAATRTSFMRRTVPAATRSVGLFDLDTQETR